MILVTLNISSLVLPLESNIGDTFINIAGINWLNVRRAKVDVADVFTCFLR